MFKFLSRKSILGSVLACAGFLLSPLSWWNDLLINIPLAYAFAWATSFVSPGHFTLSIVLGYWLTNVLGFILMHKGYCMMSGEEHGRYTTRSFIKDLSISLIYSLIIAVLALTGILKLPTEYF